MSKNTRLHPLVLGLLIAAFVLFLPVTLPVGLVMWCVHERRLRSELHSCAESTSCEKCGAILGLKSLHLADIEVKKTGLEMREKYPSVRFRLVRTLHAICTVCGARYTYFAKNKTIALEDPSASASWRKKMLGKQ